MPENSQIPNKKLCLACLILTVLLPTIIIIITNRTSKGFLPESTARNRLNTTITNTTNSTSTATSTSATYYNTTVTDSYSSTKISANYFNTSSTPPAAAVSTAATIFSLSLVATPAVLLMTSITTATKKAGTTRTKVSKDGYSDYLVSSPKCKIPNLKPFSKETNKYFKKLQYRSCTLKKLLTTVKVTNNMATLYVETERVPSYSSNGVTCCYSNVSRNQKSDSDIKHHADNTFPNLMAILTGFGITQAYETVKTLDTCPMIWYDFRKLGYITGYAEDNGEINTFNYHKKGFSVPPTDYYYRPYVLATERLTNLSKDNRYCTGPEYSGERILNLAKDFAVTFKYFPHFGFFWMNTFSHHELNAPSGMDDKLRDFFEDITKKGVTNNTIVIFISDHGMRFGPFRETLSGWLEDRLPFIYVSFPNWFKVKYRKEYENFKTNSNRLTSPYDLHMTLQHILIYAGRGYNTSKSKGCPNCKTLFKEVKADRSCSEAGIDHQWCTCFGYKLTTLDGTTKTIVLKFILDQIQHIISLRKCDKKCAKYSVASLIESRTSSQMANNVTYLLLKIRMDPKAVFETTVSFVGDIKNSNLSLYFISRIDSYKDQNKCVRDDADWTNTIYIFVQK